MNVTTPAFSNAFQASAALPVTDLFPEFFANAKTTGSDIERRAWARIDDLYVELEDEFGELYATQNPALNMAKSICQSYNCPEAVDCVLSILYLKHRNRYLTVPEEFHPCAGGYTTISPLNDSDESNSVMGFSYPGCPCEVGDIVNFNDIDPVKLARFTDFPIVQLWKHLQLDHELSAEIVSYECALRVITECLKHTLSSLPERQIPSSALQDLSRHMIEFEFERSVVTPSIGLLIHGIILQAL